MVEFRKPTNRGGYFVVAGVPDSEVAKPIPEDEWVILDVMTECQRTFFKNDIDELKERMGEVAEQPMRLVAVMAESWAQIGANGGT
jgi:hypothetical protein